ncbi:EVE domain-containing protein [Saccharobesus litoralis]|uniref:EVE domain-containing protein n=1 Tax=Saccharobesus litoralis TaxID=2172099 RepID=A0A2S0VQM6_9ALTE|nr:EVE domain-containing protein [Saccharobesus litoralis]AWB66504.1 EVE domain-containing protein [Saccharobesus litoralis]
MSRQYWLMKSEPDAFSIDDLAAKPEQTEHWDGVRNYQARNMMRDQMQMGDRIFFYHSACKVPAIVGLAEVASQAYPDHTAFDPESKYFDDKSDPQNPRWWMVDVKFVEKFTQPISLKTLKAMPELEQLALVKRGCRLSIMPVAELEWLAILNKLGSE